MEKWGRWGGRWWLAYEMNSTFLSSMWFSGWWNDWLPNHSLYTERTNDSRLFERSLRLQMPAKCIGTERRFVREKCWRGVQINAVESENDLQTQTLPSRQQCVKREDAGTGAKKRLLLTGITTTKKESFCCDNNITNRVYEYMFDAVSSSSSTGTAAAPCVQTLCVQHIRSRRGSQQQTHRDWTLKSFSLSLIQHSTTNKNKRTLFSPALLLLLFLVLSSLDHICLPKIQLPAHHHESSWVTQCLKRSISHLRATTHCVDCRPSRNRY